MEAASAGHVGVAKILLEHGAGINTHSNEFKESALTLACYKGHLDMVRFLLAAGADREHKTDEMHTALMEASMDGHVEVARLLLDSGAQVNMPTDSFESPLTLAACGGHVELAMLLLERGANIEEVNDEGYTPLMEAAREGHEEMVALLLGQGASINAQTDETQETALTLACCGGFLEVADFLIKAGADSELGASTPLMEASQEGHLELVRYLLSAGADVHAQTQTGDTALTYACENGHTDVADVLLRAGAALEHESEGGRTPLMKACRAGHLCTVQFLVGKGADVDRMTASGDHTPLSLACAGGHADVAKFLLACDADPFRKLKDNSSTLIEAAKGGHTPVVQLLLDYPHSLMLPRGGVGSEDVNGLSPAQAAALGLSHTAAQPDFAHRLLPPLTHAHPSQPHPLTQAHQHQAQPHQHQAQPHQHPQAQQLQHHPGQPHGHPQPNQHTQTQPHQHPPAPHQLPPTPPHPHPQIPSHPQIQPHQHPPPPSQPLHQPLPPPQPYPHQQVQPPPPAPAELPPNFAKVYLDVSGAAPLATASAAGSTAPAAAKHKCARKQRPVPHNDHHLPPPPDIIDDQRGETVPTQQPRNESLPETEPNIFELSVATAASAMHSLDQKFRSFGIDPIPPPENYIPIEQLPTNLDQTDAVSQSVEGAPCETQPEGACPDATAGAGDAGSVEARELSAVLAYLQREVPSLVALPPTELRSLVLQVMQAKSHEIMSDKFGGEGEGDEAIVESMEGMKVMPCTPRCEGEGEVESPAAQTELQHHFALPPLPPPAISYDDYRSSTYASPGASPITDLLNHSRAVGFALGVKHSKGRSLTPPQAPPARDHQHQATNTPALKKKVTLSISTKHISTNRSEAAPPAPGAAPVAPPPAPAPAAYSAMDVDAETDSNHDTALTLACAGGHEDLKIVEVLLNHGADIEAQSERTKDTPLSLACSGGRYEVVELILSRGANKEHRNVSDYTPLSLAASGGYVNIIRLLLQHQAEINSRTGSKLGISPLMLAAMNGHTAAVRLLLDCGSDINAQIETNRNTALTLACFQGRHEVVSLLLDRKANVEHRAKTGLTPLMEAASGGYVEVGRVLLDKGADVNAPPVSCLMAAFRKGHTKVVKWMVGVVTQFPSDQEMTRYICTISDKEVLEKCQECVRVIRAAKETQAARANQNATILLEELESERCREETRRQAAARRRERKKKKKMEKK
ncbi:unnamed protein product, partial [Leptidea sinapis]